MLTPVQPSPISVTSAPASLDAASPAKLPVSPSALQTGPTIEANLGGATSPAGQRAMAAMDFGEKWITALGRLADMTDINLGGALSFAHRDVRHLARDLHRDAPDSRLTRDTNRLLNDWGTQGPQVFQTIRHGLIRNAEQDIGQLGPTLARAGVTSPQVQGAIRDFAATLGQIDSLMSRSPGPGPISPGGGPFGPFQVAVDQARMRLFQAMQMDAQAHPEHVQTLNAVGAKVESAMRELGQGLGITIQLEHGLRRDLMQLGWTPKPANAAANGDARDLPQAA